MRFNGALFDFPIKNKRDKTKKHPMTNVFYGTKNII